MSGNTQSTPFQTIAFWTLGLGLTLYVAMCTPYRDNVRASDAWEHHRAIVALAADLSAPANPTFDLDTPSIRYTPYAVAQALVCRATGLDPYDVLSASAALNTLGLVVGVWMLLRAYGVGAAGATALIVMVSLWGGPPNYASSYALADLPLHQVNSSAFVMALNLLIWAMVRRCGGAPGRWFVWIFVIALGTIAMISHPISGAFGFGGMVLIAVTAPRVGRWRLAAGVVVTIAATLGLCLLWPWFDFASLLWQRDRMTGLPPGMFRDLLRLMLLIWCWPAILLSIGALHLWRGELGRLCLLGFFAALALTLLIGMPQSSLLLLRQVMLAVVFCHLLLAVYIYEEGLFDCRTWPDRMRALLTADAAVAGRSALQIIMMVFLLYCLVPQLWMIASQPHLGRAYIAGLVGREPKQTRYLDIYRQLLEPVGQRDVVMADALSGWPVPSVRGRVMYALHAEFLEPFNENRSEDVDAFFGDASDEQRAAILRKWNAKWILLDPSTIGRRAYERLLVDDAVVSRAGGMTLMDAGKWIASRLTSE